MRTQDIPVLASFQQQIAHDGALAEALMQHAAKATQLYGIERDHNIRCLQLAAYWRAERTLMRISRMVRG